MAQKLGIDSNSDGSKFVSGSAVSFPRFGKVSHSKLNLTVSKLTPISNDCQPAVAGRLLDNLASLATSSIDRQRDHLLIGLGHSDYQLPRTSIHVELLHWPTDSDHPA
jgi:hypothetical protein